MQGRRNARPAVLVPCGAPGEERARYAERVDLERAVIEARGRVELREARLVGKQRFGGAREHGWQAEAHFEEIEHARRAERSHASRGDRGGGLHAVEGRGEL